MSKSIIMAGAIVTLADVDFTCPVCECPHGESDYYNRLRNSKHGIINKQCKGCKTPLTITTNIMGDVIVWEKADYTNNNIGSKNLIQ